jgi:hypothetical protein
MGVGPGVSGDAEAIGDLGSDRNRKTQEALDGAHGKRGLAPDQSGHEMSTKHHYISARMMGGKMGDKPAAREVTKEHSWLTS